MFSGFSCYFATELTSVLLSFIGVCFSCFFERSSSQANLAGVKAFKLFVFISLILLFIAYFYSPVSMSIKDEFFTKTNHTQTISFFILLFFVFFTIFLLFTNGVSFAYFSLALLSLCGSLLLICADGFLSFYIALELQSIPIFIMVAQNKTLKSRTGYEGMLKYFVISSLFSCILIYGISMVYANFGSVNFKDIYQKSGIEYSLKTQPSQELNTVHISENLSATQNLNQGQIANNVSVNKIENSGQNAINQGDSSGKTSLNITYGKTFVLGALLILFAILGKLSIAPFHFWSPDLYQKITKSSLFFVLSLPKISILFSLFCISNLFLCILLPSDFIIIKNILFICIAISFVIGSFGGLGQNNLKRLLAYSGILNGGFMVSTVFMGYAQFANSLFYLVIYVMNLFVFLSCLSVLKKKYSISFKTFNDIALVSKFHPFISFYMLCSVFSMAGIPPFAGFFTKFLILIDMFSQNIIVFVFALVCSVVACFYYISIVKTMYFAKSGNFQQLTKSKKISSVNGLLVLCFVLTLLNFAVCANPSFIIKMFFI